MPSVTESIKYPMSMTVVSFGVGAILIASLLDFLLAESMVAGLLGLWGIIIAGIGVFAAVAIWLLGKLD